MSNEQQNTEVSQIDIDLAEILGTATGNNVITQNNNNGPKSNIFKNDPPKTFTAADLEGETEDQKKVRLEKEEAAKKAAEEEKKRKEEEAAELLKKNEGKTAEQIIAETVSEGGGGGEGAGGDDKNKGKKPYSKDLLKDVLGHLIEKKEFFDFAPEDVDNKKLEDYTKDEVLELIQLNLEKRDEKLKEQVPVEFFNALPPEFQTAFTYVSNGGTDIKGMLRVLSETVETRELDLKSEDDQEKIVYNYLKSTNFGTPEEIEVEINGWKDRNELEKKATQFKPKLDAMNARTVEQRLKDQEKRAELAKKQSAIYMDTVYKTLAPGLLGDIKLDKKTQGILYNGLVRPDYQSAFNGAPTNLLGKYLEEYQFGEKKDLSRVAEVLWLLHDREGFLNKQREMGASEKAKAVAKKLKSEESSKNAAGNQQDDNDSEGSRGTQTVKRKGPANIFK
jgi:hypothetical protein